MAEKNAATPTILVVEDFEDTRQMMAKLLEMSGYRIMEAVNGQEAVEIARRECPDLILMDLSLPMLDGLAATRLIRKTSKLCDVPIVAVTAHQGTAIREEAFAAGCNEYLSKPVDFAQLDNLLGRFLPRH